ncbi:hypothetical protein [Cytophaga aurantiaca]|uniref:hypothetical protein n=1 Tax=Cytophaga aurantiaca TaxID=29530 RepID=UPI00037AE1BE|nr:hypothetical protein [Cytophaga aurantiaca]
MNSRLFLLTAFLSIGFFSCKKEKIIEVEKQHAWKKVGGYDFDEKITTNSAVSGDYLFIMGKDYSQIGIGETSNNLFSGVQSDLYPDRQYPIGENYAMGVTDEGMICLNNLIYHSLDYFLLPKYTDTAFGGLNHYKYTNSPMASGAINENDDLLTFYQKKDLKTRMLFVSVKESFSGMEIDTFFTKKIDIPSPYITSRPIMFGYDDCFLISYANGIYKILSDGSYSQKYTFTSFPRQFFSKGDSVYAVSDNYIYFSPDKGETWTPKFNSSFERSVIKPYQTNGKIIGSYNGQLFHIQIKNNGIDYVELINDGLETSVINSVTYFDHKYFVTTNSGVFYRGESEFFSYK